MIKHCDVVIDLQAGDTGKGKVANYLAEHIGYDMVLRYNGGANAGHTIYVKGTKIVTHQVPVGILHDIPSVIGLGCVVNFSQLEKELDMLRQLGFTAPLYIDCRAHVTTDAHLAEDGQDTKIGTTRMGIGPTYRDKYARTGVRVGDGVTPPAANTMWEVCDVYDMLYNQTRYENILCEGAQGFQIDIDWGDYPFVTSSHCTIGSVALNGIAPRYLRNVYGVMKAYETYSGFKTHYTEDTEIFKKIQQAGHEWGATTGRERQVRWLHLDGVIQAMYINNITHLIINKIDVLDSVGAYGVVFKNQYHKLNSHSEFIEFVENTIKWFYEPSLQSITWSTSAETV